MNYRVIDKEKYYRSGVFRHFTEDCKCSKRRLDVMRLDGFGLLVEDMAMMIRFYRDVLGFEILHHEIYLSDARKVAPEKLKTVIRHPIKAKGS